MTAEQQRIVELRQAWEKQKWGESKAKENFDHATSSLANEQLSTEKYLNAYLAALEVAAAMEPRR